MDIKVLLSVNSQTEYSNNSRIFQVQFSELEDIMPWVTIIPPLYSEALWLVWATLHFYLHLIPRLPPSTSFGSQSSLNTAIKTSWSCFPLSFCLLACSGFYHHLFCQHWNLLSTPHSSTLSGLSNRFSFLCNHLHIFSTS